MAREFELRREVALEATPEQVWWAIATGPGLATWFMPMEMDPESDMVVAWDPPKRLAIQTPAAEDGATHAFEYLVEGRGQGSTILRFVHRGFLGDDWSGEYETTTGDGWDMYFHTLAQYLRYFVDRPAVYIEAEGPASSADAGRWSLLVEALGKAAPVRLGTPVRIELPGGPSVEGVVDYLTDNFVGIRTGDALVRFHGRSPIGMTVAISHHAYGEPLDTEPVQRGWEAWLARTFDGAGVGAV